MSEVLAQLEKKGGGSSYLVEVDALSGKPAASLTIDSDSQTTIASNTPFGTTPGYPQGTMFDIVEFTLGRNASISFSATEGGSLSYCAYVISVNGVEVYRTTYTNQAQTFSGNYSAGKKIKIQIYNKNLSSGGNGMSMVING